MELDYIDHPIQSTTVIEEPFLVQVYDQFLSSYFYERLSLTFPTLGFHEMGDGHNKFNLNELHPEFWRFLQQDVVWADFYQWCLADKLKYIVCSRLGLDNSKIGKRKFEFSAVPADGGLLNPHPDTGGKLATVVFFFPHPEWRQRSWGGNFEVLRVKKSYTTKNPTFDDVETVESVAYQRNRMVMMKRSPVSFHAVRPLTGPAGSFRRSVTVNFLRS